MVLTDYDEERTMRLLKDEYREEGREEEKTNMVINIMNLHLKLPTSKVGMNIENAIV